MNVLAERFTTVTLWKKLMTDEFQYRPDMRVVSSARNFIKSLCEVYGADQGMAVWDHIRKILGDQAASDIFIGMITGTANLTIHSIGHNKIDAIKEVRALTGCGLKEAKDLVEAVQFGRPQTIDVTSLSDDVVNTFCTEMARFGCSVK